MADFIQSGLESTVVSLCKNTGGAVSGEAQDGFELQIKCGPLICRCRDKY